MIDSKNIIFYLININKNIFIYKYMEAILLGSLIGRIYLDKGSM